MKRKISEIKKPIEILDDDEDEEDEGYDYSVHKVSVLKGFLKKRGLYQSGNKMQLVNRLVADDEINNIANLEKKKPLAKSVVKKRKFITFNLTAKQVGGMHSKAKEYQNSNYWSNLVILDEVTVAGHTYKLMGKVKGSLGTYAVTSNVQDKYITGSCACPVAYNCKHSYSLVLVYISNPELFQKYKKKMMKFIFLCLGNFKLCFGQAEISIQIHLYLNYQEKY